LKNIERVSTPISATKTICLIAVLVATLTGGKTVIAFIPNVEIMTTLFIVYTLVFGWRKTMVAAIVFVMIEIIIWPAMPSWIILYFIYWPLMVTVVAILPRKCHRLRVVLSIIVGIIFTISFGVLSSFIDVIIFGGIGTPYFWPLFGAIYVAGAGFFATHIISNLLLLPVLLPVLYTALKPMKVRYFAEPKKRVIVDLVQPAHTPQKPLI